MDSIALVNLALKVVSERLILIMTQVMCFVLAIWVMQGQSWQQVLTLLIFVIFSYLIIRNRDSKHETA